MSAPIKLIAFCGSLRRASYNRMVLHAFIERLPALVECDTIDVGDFPLYNEDLDTKDFQFRLLTAQKKIMDADGVVFVAPEYNFGIPGVLKNAIDWLSRMTPQPFAAKPTALFGASMSLLGTARAQYQLRQTLVFLDCRPLNKPEVMIAQAQNKFADGKLTDEVTGALLVDLGEALVLSCRQARDL